jgi:ubiquinone/menaquinone biosynthesis C-methylase UbiE
MSENNINKNDNSAEPDLEFIAHQLRKPSGDFASEIAEKMDAGNRPLFELTLDTLKIGKGDHVLEIGFGSGKNMSEVLSKAKDINLTGIDYSAEMVQQAGHFNADHVASGKLSLLVGNSDDLPIAGNTFDVIYCNMVIFFWDKPETHLREIYRVLKPGGTFYTGFRSKESMMKFPFTQFGFNLYSEKEWESVLISNGFSDIRTVKSKDPEWDAGENKVNLISICMAAGKPG